MDIKMYQVDAFSDTLFGGNPAAVCLLDAWLPDQLMLSIAGENNLAETAFCVADKGRFELRWFTPEVEIDLCGHATLATSHVLFREEKRATEEIVFHTKMSGELKVRENRGMYTLNFPSRMPQTTETPAVIASALSEAPVEVLKSRDYFFVYQNEDTIKKINPDQKLLATINDSFAGIIVTAPGDECDFVSRFFTPGASVFEDPVTGSAHCSLIPYWSDKLGKSGHIARQLSPRGGELLCEDLGERVEITGSARTFFSGHIRL